VKELKENIIHQLTLNQQNRLAELEKDALDLKTSLSSESKSTAGDKHDTGRAMIHLEQEKMQHQFHETQSKITLLNKISQLPNSSKAQFGTLVQTPHAYFLLGIGLGKQTIHSVDVYCIGLDSPIGKILLNKQINDSFVFNSSSLKIIDLI
jgi:hypothetical protein